MMWALILITCSDWNNCITKKQYFTSQGECIAERNSVQPRLAHLKLKPTIMCIQQENRNEESEAS